MKQRSLTELGDEGVFATPPCQEDLAYLEALDLQEVLTCKRKARKLLYLAWRSG